MPKRIVLFLIFTMICMTWAVPKPMESIENYNVLMVHGAYGSEKGIKANANLKEADSASKFLGDATLGSYTSEDRITKWIGTNVFEEPDIGKKRNPANAYIYNWRSFTNPANSSLNNAHELADRQWNIAENGASRFGKRRALFEEAQEVKATLRVSKNGKDSLYVGQIALDTIRQNPDLYRQLASRYILIGHSMGGIVSREYVQGDFYNGDVDKIITLDSPHEGTGALNMQIYKEARGWTDEKIRGLLMKSMASMTATGILLAVMGMEPVSVEAGMCITLFSSAIAGGASIPLTKIFSTEVYTKDDSLVHYVDPYQTGFGTIRNLNALPYDAEKLPMFRVLGSKNSMTFGDPTHVDYGLLGSLYLENFSLPVLNMIGQMGGGGDLSTIYVNALTAGIAGIVGIPLIEQGSSLVTEASGLGKHVRLLNDENVDVRKEQFNAAVQAESSDGDFATAMGIASGAVLALDFTLGLINPAAAKAAKTGIVVAFSATMGFSVIGGAVATGFDDLAESHMMPLYKKNLEKWFGNTNSFSLVNAGSSEYTPYLMEDFLYERPFVNLALLDSATLDSLQMNPEAKLNRNCYYLDSRNTARCAVGLFAKADDFRSAQRMQPVSALVPLRFRSSSDWSRMGVKVDRWERVDGLTPDGELAPKSVPIRHMERYAAPSIAVDDWIEKYSFVVDDLMPHRLRQIRMNFNYQEEIAWECDISKDAQASDACVVYKRSGGGEWAVDSSVGDNGRVRHPVQKNGIFDFEPRKYGYSNLLLLQKDNQNTVTVSTVNKIGLSNTQRFYYLFKATDNLLEPLWPLPGVAVNRVSGFSAHVSVLDYQGFSVVSARDAIFQDTSLPSPSSFLPMTRVPSGNRDAIFTSEREMSGLSGGYVWQFRTVTMDSVGGTLDSSDFYNVPFTVDTVPPSFRLSAEASALNPDSVSFLARFAWDGAGVENPDIRAMRWQLSRVDGGLADSLELSSLYDVASQDFAVPFDSASRKFLAEDGLYRVSAYAVDNAAPNASAYDAVNALVSKIADGTVSAGDWERVQGLGLNAGSASAEFRVDRTPPVLKFDKVGAVVPEGASAVGEYASLERPHRREGFAYVSDDSLLSVAYTVSS